MRDLPHTPGKTPVLHGSIFVLLQFDVCEEIRLDQLQERISGSTQEKPRLKRPMPKYVRYKRPPVLQPIQAFALESGEPLRGEIRYYDYGVLSLVLEQPFATDWDQLTGLASRWIWEIDFAERAKQLVTERLEYVAPALIKPYKEWLSEDYLIFHVTQLDAAYSGADLIQRYGAQIAQIVRGDTEELAESECNEVLHSRISYYANDVTVIGWNAAFIYDTPEGAETGIQLLEYANSQLLDFRHYDDLLTNELQRVYKLLDEGTGRLARWRLARSATRLYTVLLDVMELTERTDNAIKFLSDMFAARLYRLAAQKVGVPDYKDLVTQKVNTAEELYTFMVDQFNQSRGFFLEVTVVIILIVELVMLFLGKPM